MATSAAKVAEFRAHYLYSGNASESAEAVGIPKSTGRDLARKLRDEEDFVTDRRALRALALDELVAMRMRVARKALRRFNDDTPPEPGEIDKRPDYGKLVIEAEKSAQHLAKVEGEEPPQRAPVTINIVRAGAAEVDDGSGP